MYRNRDTGVNYITVHPDHRCYMSSLLQVPFARQLIGPNKVGSILAAEKAYVTEALEGCRYSSRQQLCFRGGTLLDYAYSVAVHRDYYGHV